MRMPFIENVINGRNTKMVLKNVCWLRLGYNGGICVGCSVSMCITLLLQTGPLLLLVFTRPFKAFFDTPLIAVYCWGLWF
jgi:hypothetical protein